MLNYIYKDSIIHKTNSTIKLLILIVVSIYIFTVKNYYTLNIILGISIIVLILSKIPLKYYIKSIIHSIYFVVLTFLINLIFSDVIYSFSNNFNIKFNNKIYGYSICNHKYLISIKNIWSKHKRCKPNGRYRNKFYANFNK